MVELFPRRAPLPRTLPDVLDRVFQPQYTSRLALDTEFFDRISHIVDLVARLSTVDDVQSGAGRVAAVLALHEQLDGRAGSYGTGASAASGAAPAVPVVPGA